MHLTPSLGKTVTMKKATGLALPAAQKILTGPVLMMTKEIYNMKKRIRVLFTVFIMCLILATPTFAASSAPSVELMNIVLDGPSKTFNSFSPTLYFRNNSGKSVKYYDWYFTLYNRVGDPTPNEATNSSTVHLQVIGPISPDEPISRNN